MINIIQLYLIYANILHVLIYNVICVHSFSTAIDWVFISYIVHGIYTFVPHPSSVFTNWLVILSFINNNTNFTCFMVTFELNVILQ